MKIFKGYSKNPYRPKASIVERYITEETTKFCSEYLAKAQAVGVPTSRHDDRINGKGTRGIKVQTKDTIELSRAHLYILNNTDEVLPYISAHQSMLKTKNPKMSERLLVKEHNNKFVSWFRSQIFSDENASDTLKWLAHGPKHNIITWSGYDISKYSFYTKSQDDNSTVQNSGVSIEATSMHFSSSKDKNPIMASISYFGVIEEIWEVDYTKFRVPLFKCRWVDSNTGVQFDQMGFTLIDLKKIGHKEEPFIMAYQAKQVFYVTDPCNDRWSVVLQGKGIDVKHEIEDESDYFIDSPISTRMTSSNEDVEEDDFHATRNDHDEGMWENLAI